MTGYIVAAIVVGETIVGVAGEVWEENDQQQIRVGYSVKKKVSIIKIKGK